jgi:hypothetical protein
MLAVLRWMGRAVRTDDVVAGELGKRERVAYWVALVVFLLIALGTVLMAWFTPISPDDPPVNRVESVETTSKSDGTTTTVARRQTTTGDDGGSIFGWKVGGSGRFAVQLTAGLLLAYLVAGLVHRVVCGHYAVKMLGVELADRATPIAAAADAASATADERRVLAEDTTAERANLAAGISPSSEPVDVTGASQAGVPDLVFGLSDLGASLAAVLRRLLSPPPRMRVHGAEDMARILSNRGAIPPELATAVERVLRECRTAGNGRARARARLDEAAMAYGPRLLADLQSLGSTVGRAFEQHVLDQLGRVPGCTITKWRVVEGSQVDAMATRGRSDVIVEVRARVGPGAIDAVEETHAWLEPLPEHFPVLLIVPAEPTMSPTWELIRGRRGLTVLSWDEGSDRLATVLTSMFEQDQVAPPMAA